MSTFKKLQAIDCSKHVEKKGKFTYLSWSWAWSTLKEHCPDATFTKHVYGEQDYIKPYMIDSEGYAYVSVSVTVDNCSATEIMPVLNNQNKSIQNPSSFDVNTALQRCLVKAIAFHGLGLYIYAGEDLPPSEPVYASDADLKQIRTLLSDTNTDESAFLHFLKIEPLEKLEKVNFSNAIKALNKKLAVIKAAETGDSQE
jgi:hypothetical protein